MTLCEYLNKYFPNGEQGTFEEKPVDLTTHFIEKFGVDVKKENDLFLFKYNMICARFSFPITHECRGIILRHNEKWEVVSRPYSKFFNWHEGYCVIKDTDFAPTLQIIEKADGTAIQVWHDDKKNEWRISTLGTISTMAYDQAFRPDDTFANLFLKTIKNIDWSLLDKGYTYLFELCSHDNRIVTQYQEDIVYLIAAREKDHGLYKTYQEMDDLCLEMMEKGSNVKRPDLKFFYELGFTSFKDVLEWVEKQAEESDKYGKFPEGFIVYRGGIPVAKMKNSKYLAAFHVSGGNKGHAKNAIIQAVFEGNIDDVYEMMIPELQQFADSIKEKVGRLGLEVMEVGKKLGKDKYANQKEYALAVQSHCTTKTLQSFFFSNKEVVLKGDNLNEVYTGWIRDNYKRFLDLWKVKEDAKDNRE